MFNMAEIEDSGTPLIHSPLHPLFQPPFQANRLLPNPTNSPLHQTAAPATKNGAPIHATPLTILATPNHHINPWILTNSLESFTLGNSPLGTSFPKNSHKGPHPSCTLYSSNLPSWPSTAARTFA